MVAAVIRDSNPDITGIDDLDSAGGYNFNQGGESHP